LAFMDQAITVVAVLAGAASTYIFTRLSERDRFSRDMKLRWDQRRLDAYAAYISAVKVTGRSANEIHRRRLQGATADDDLVTELTNSHDRLADRFELLPLLADGPTIRAAHELNAAVWALKEPAMRPEILEEAEWLNLADNWIKALNDFHAAARASLNVPGAFVRYDTAALAVSRPERRVTADKATNHGDGR
jgi:hypothetical protein